MSLRRRSSLGIPAPQVRPEDPLRVMERARARSTLLFVCIVALYGLLALRASSVMLFPDERLVARARAQFQRSVKVEAPRGPIVDRDGSPLAITVENVLCQHVTTTQGAFDLGVAIRERLRDRLRSSGPDTCTRVRWTTRTRERDQTDGISQW